MAGITGISCVVEVTFIVITRHVHINICWCAASTWQQGKLSLSILIHFIITGLWRLPTGILVAFSIWILTLFSFFVFCFTYLKRNFSKEFIYLLNHEHCLQKDIKKWLVMKTILRQHVMQMLKVCFNLTSCCCVTWLDCDARGGMLLLLSLDSPRLTSPNGLTLRCGRSYILCLNGV